MCSGLRLALLLLFGLLVAICFCLALLLLFSLLLARHICLTLFILLGFIGGFFGIGGGAFLTATLNLVMLVPLKVSAACSGVLLALSNACAIWTYIKYGALIAIFAAPWMLGQVIGGIIGVLLGWLASFLIGKFGGMTTTITTRIIA